MTLRPARTPGSSAPRSSTRSKSSGARRPGDARARVGACEPRRRCRRRRPESAGAPRDRVGGAGGRGRPRRTDRVVHVEPLNVIRLRDARARTPRRHGVGVLPRGRGRRGARSARTAAAFDRLKLQPRVLVDVTTSTRRRRARDAGHGAVLVAPVALQKLAHPDGEAATARAAAARGRSWSSRPPRRCDRRR